MSNTTAVSLIQARPISVPSPSQQSPRNAIQDVKRTQAPSPGRFQHPAINEVAKRTAATTFTTRDLELVAGNVAVLVLTFVSTRWIDFVLDLIVGYTGLDAIPVDRAIILLGVRTILLANTFIALRPILPYFRKPVEINDISLTPSQRALLGLPPAEGKASQEQKDGGSYITPPRYRRSSPSPFAGTPQSGGSDKRSISANYSASPLSTSRHTLGFSPTPQQGSATPGRRASASSFAQSSPLFRKTLSNSTSLNELNPDFTESTRSLLAGNASTSSFNSTLRKSYSARDSPIKQPEPGTPSPNTRERSKVNLQPGLNYKWLYERGLKVGRNGAPEF